MAIAPQIARQVSEITGIPLSTVETILRRLGEGGLLPRGTRGRRPPDISNRDLARIVIALMSVGDGIEGSAARVVQAVQQVGSLRCGGSLGWARDDTAEKLGSATLVVPGGSFLDQITHLIDQCSDSKTAPIFEQVVLAVGLSRSEARTLGWVEVTGDGEVIQGGAIHWTTAIGGRRVFFGDIESKSFRGMIREARLTMDALAELASIAFPGSATSWASGDVRR